MMEAAPRAALMASSDRWVRASSMTWTSTDSLRVAAAAATKVPHCCCSVSEEERDRVDRFRERSLAHSGKAERRLSMLMGSRFVVVQVVRSGDGAVARQPIWPRASMVAAPACQLQAHSSSDWRASSWRRTSSVLRPTESAVTETD